MKNIGRSLLAMVILATAAVTAGAGDNKEKLFIVINYSIYHCNAVIELNGIQITKSNKDSVYTVTGFSEAGMWIHPGKNTLTVTIRPPEKKIDSSGKPTVEVSLSTVKEGQMTNEGNKFLEVRIPEKDAAPQLENLTSSVIKTENFTPAYVPPSEVWVKAKKVKLDAEARKQIASLVKEYHAALKKKDPEAIWSFLEFSSTDMMKLRHQPVDDLKTKFMTSFKEIMADKNFILLPLDTEKLVMKPVADGTMIQVTDQDGREPIRSKEIKDSGSYTFGVYVGNIDGKWIIVR
jgi:hypothetical protein